MPWGQGQELTSTFHTFISSIGCLHLATFRSQASIHCFLSLFFQKKSRSYQIWPCRKIGQGQPRVKYDGLEFQMLHTKFNGKQSTSSRLEGFSRVFTIYGRGGHLGHVTQMPRTNFRSPYPRRLHINLALIGHAVSDKKMFETIVNAGRTPEHGYTINSPMSLRLRWANNDYMKIWSKMNSKYYTFCHNSSISSELAQKVLKR